jgi:translation initiation factor IF-3
LEQSRHTLQQYFQELEASKAGQRVLQLSMNEQRDKFARERQAQELQNDQNQTVIAALKSQATRLERDLQSRATEVDSWLEQFEHTKTECQRLQQQLNQEKAERAQEQTEVQSAFDMLRQQVNLYLNYLIHDLTETF